MPSQKQLLQIIHIQTEIAKLSLDLDGVMQYVVDQILLLVDADGAVVELVEGGKMVYRAASGIARDQIGLQLRIDTSLSGLSVLTGEILSCDDSETDPRVNRTACQEVGLRSMIVMPLKHRGVTVGVLKALSAQPHKFKKGDITLLGMLSEVIAASMYFSVTYDIDELLRKASHDSMTGLANRAVFMDRLRNVVALNGRDKQSSSGVLMIDMDGLKQINDVHGHRIGDAVIIEFSSRIKKVTRDTDTAARLGGDEFGVILTPLEDPEGLDSVIQRINTEIKQPFLYENQEYRLGASVGSAFIPIDGTEPDKLMELADQRMYAVKRSRDRGVVKPKLSNEPSDKK